MAGYIVYSYPTPAMSYTWTDISTSATLVSSWFDCAVPALTGTNIGYLDAKSTVTMIRHNGEDLWDAQPTVGFGNPPYTYFNVGLNEVGATNFWSPVGSISMSQAKSWYQQITKARIAVGMWKGPWGPQNIVSLTVTVSAGTLYIWHYQYTNDTPVVVEASKVAKGDHVFNLPLTSGYGIVSGYNPASGSLASGTPMPYSGTVPISGYMATRMRYIISQSVSGNIDWDGQIPGSGVIRKFT